MHQIIKQHKYFFILTLLYLLAGIYVLEYTQKGAIEIFINRHHNVIYDLFFKFITNFGDGFFSVLIIIFLFLRKTYYGIALSICFITTTIITQGMKRYIYEDALRPSRFLEGIKDLYYIEGLEIHSYFSFPSGHSSGAFTIFLFLALISKSKVADIFFFIIALLVALSRMYLMQHFFEDTYCGALIGIFVTLLLYYLINNHTNWKDNQRLNRPLFTLR